jgi:hypothetical protein
MFFLSFKSKEPFVFSSALFSPTVLCCRVKKLRRESVRPGLHHLTMPLCGSPMFGGGGMFQDPARRRLVWSEVPHIMPCAAAGLRNYLVLAYACAFMEAKLVEARRGATYGSARRKCGYPNEQRAIGDTISFFSRRHNNCYRVLLP